MPVINLIVLADFIYLQRQSKSILVAVIGADIELWSAPFNGFPCTLDSSQLSALNIHFDKGDIIGNKVVHRIEADGDTAFVLT